MPHEDIDLKILRNAAFLRREFAGREITKSKDGDAKDRRRKTIYIYDTDVIVTFCEPWRTGASGSRSFGGYGEIVSPPSEDKASRERAMDIAAILAEHSLFKMRSRSIPIFLFDGHHQETNNVYQLIADRLTRKNISPNLDFAQEQARRLTQLAALIGWRADAIKASQGQLSPLVKALLQTLSAVDRYPRTDKEDEAALRNLVELRSRAGNIYPTSSAAALLKDTVPSEVVEALRIFETSSEENTSLTDVEQEDLHVIRRNFSRWLRAEQTADHEAIARLYLVNARLKDTQWRVVLVTGTTSLVNACHANFPEIDGLDIGRSSDLLKSFAPRFVRHIWAGTTEALLEPSTDENGADQEEQFVNWLDGFLADCSDPDRFGTENLDKFVEGPSNFLIGEVKRRVGRAVEEWQGLTDHALHAYRFREIGLGGDAALKLQSKIVHRVAVGRDTFPPVPFSALVNEFEEEYARERDLSYTKLSEIGIEVILSSRGVGLRNPPDLAFETMEHTDKIFKKLCIKHGYHDPDTRLAEFEADYEKIWRDAREKYETDDPRLECYLCFLALGAAFASGNLWGVALSQGERSLAIIARSKTRRDPIPVKLREDGINSFISGREAHFLCATAQRMAARTETEFVRAKRHLDDAEVCLELDWRNESALSTTKLRFKGETLALKLSLYYEARKRSELKGGPIDFCDLEAAEVFDATKELLDYLRFVESCGVGFEGSGRFHFGAVLQKQRPSIIHKISGTGDETVKLWPTFGRVTLLHISTNLIQAAVIRSFRARHNHGEAKEFPLSFENLRFAVELMSYFTGKTDTKLLNHYAPADHLLRASPLVHLYRETGALLIAQMAAPEMTTPTNVTGLFKKSEVGLKVADYDNWRFPALLDQCIYLVGLSEEERHRLIFN